MEGSASPTHMTKLAYGCASIEDLRRWLEGHDGEARTATRYLPKRHEQMIGGSLYWIHQHAIIGRTPLIGFEQRDDGRWWIRMEPRLVPVSPLARRAHQGWRYLSAADAPRDLAEGETPGDALPVGLAGRLARLGLV
ncbi:MAG: DUF1489 domain-containing protein [Novosphingobium sp.]